MEICVVAFSQLCADGRVRRQIDALSKLGRVTSIGYGPQPPGSAAHYSIPDSCRYLPLTPIGVASLLLGLNDLANRKTPALRWVSALMKRIDADLIVLNDVQTVGLFRSIESRTKVLVDMHEYAPEEMSDDWRFRVLLQRYYTFLCKRYLPRAELVTTVSGAIAEQFRRTLNIRCEVVQNSTPYQQIEIGRCEREGLRLVHSGLAARARKIEVMINAVRKNPNAALDLFLVQAPRQKRYLKNLKKLVQDIPNVTICDPVPHDELIVKLSRYDAGLLVISPSNFSLANCLPNKLFEYVQARLMVVTGPTPDISGLVGRYQLGVVAENFTVDALHTLLTEITADQVVFYKTRVEEAARHLCFENDANLLRGYVKGLFDRD